MKKLTGLIVLFSLFIVTAPKIYGDKIMLITGQQGQEEKQYIVSPNLNSNEPEKGRWNDEKPVTLPKANENGSENSSTSNGNSTSQKAAKPIYPEHLVKPAVNTEPTSQSDVKTKQLDEVVSPIKTNNDGNSNTGTDKELPSRLDLKGNKGGSFIASNDCNLTINPCLRTIAGATMTVKVFDENGREIKYSGKSLLQWSRPNDSDYAPLKWKGESRDESMYLQNQGDYSPTENLQYKIPLKKGQKISVTIAGTPVSSNSISIKSQHFE